jgi:predicted ATP-grasp superfamily ATP-dependent carboligase
MLPSAPSVSAAAETAPRGAKAVPGALVVGGALGALGVIRSLGRQGIPVCFLTHDHPIAKFSRYVEHSFAWAGPDHPGALEALLDLVRRHHLDAWVLFVCGDSEVRFAAQNHAALSKVLRLTTPPWEVARWCHDKRLTYKRASEVGVDAPWSYYPRDRDDLARLDCRFPLVLKPAMREQENPYTQAKAWRVDDWAELMARYDEAAALVGPHAVVLQEMIAGGGERQFSFAAVCDHGEPVASLVARRTRQYPIDFGYTSTFVEAIEEPAVEAAARRMLGAIGFTGLVEVEFKFDASDACFKILDINPRSWTWIGLGAAAGVDFPLIAWQMACGAAVTPVRAHPGAAWVHISRDLVAGCHEIWRGRRSLADYLKSFGRRLVFAAFAKDDPLPAFLELPLVVARVLTRRLPAHLHALRRIHPVNPRPMH